MILRDSGYRRATLVPLMGWAVGFLLTLWLVKVLDWIVGSVSSTSGGRGSSDIFLILSPITATVLVTVVLRKRHHVALITAWALVLGGAGVYAVEFYSATQNIFGLHSTDGPPGATAYLSRATPGPFDGANDSDTPLTRFTADYLNRRHPRYAYTDTVYLDGSVASTAPNKVSVMPLTDNKWGAVAQSSRTGRCFAIVIERDANDSQFGNTLFGTGPDDEPCTASLLSDGKITFDGWDDA